MARRIGTRTLALHGGAGPAKPGDPVSPLIVTATSFHTEPDAIGFSANDLAGTPPPFYTRWGNPTVQLLEDRLTALEGGAGTVAFGSGMAAISALFLSRLSAGDHLVLSNVCYAGVAELAQDILPRFGITATLVDTSNTDAVAAAIRPGVTRLVHIETPANPILRLSDIAAIADIAHGAGVALSVDSTIATPIATQPLSLGADYVVHSLTKYICGHGDALGGSVTVRDADQLAPLRSGALIHHGGALSPFAAWLLLRGLETLPGRMSLHEANARILAHFLSQHRSVKSVLWPGLDSHPQAELTARQMRNASGLLSFTVQGDSKALADRLARDLKVIAYAVSLGKTKSLLFYIPTEDILRSSFRLEGEAAASYRAIAGSGVFRFSVGLEDQDDLIDDLARCLD
ncbi:PLP-dependent aspartate aminotransferase family protein [Kaistia dalseonensis]|uniref:Cystathionine gamma-synthase/methionine-gamma-lyase n=1 Tax=Kaistia dalseonensis TaxID=410840 RepID=A0ABU0H717_9HYPH|nr:PLP-dependent aspartate aminotransferase family protein [Kaistia dalseonensis]MCX5495501.1 PLP-dependent aspartate aminotransferase family protein [Kaistia dalseonensis]MDQ0438093.1 cystathionine gamma-synthase/methionine-gamma-lyase [Kaistia dalseonensis]